MTLVSTACALVLLFFLSGIAVTNSDGEFSERNSQSFVNYITNAALPDGEREVRMRFGDVIVREASITKTNEAGVRTGLILRQLASGPHLLQLIYKVGEGRASRREIMKLLECEMINDWGSADQFRNRFRDDLRRSGVSLQVPPNHLDFLKTENHTVDVEDISLENMELAQGDFFDLDQGMDEFRNVSVRILRNDEIIGDLQHSFDMIAQQRQCRRLHRKMKKVAGQHKQSLTEDTSSGMDESEGHKLSGRFRREAFRVGIMPGTLWCGDGSLADRYEEMGAHVGTDRCCREHDGCPFIIHGMTSNYGVFNYRMHTVSHCTCDESILLGGGRERREADINLHFPGTKWCGKGFSANETKHLGGFTGTDKCCRTHDLDCPYYVEAFEEKYQLFNWRAFTISHCSCDERFRSCLKQTNTGASNFVGKLFFNVVQTKCFVLKPDRACTKRSWWGKCIKYEYKKQAHLRDPTPY